MANVTVLITEEEIKLVGAWQCSNGKAWDAEGCFGYCNTGDEILDRHQARKLIEASTTLALHGGCGDKYWYRNRNNFINSKVDHEVDQTFRDIFIEKLIEKRKV